MAKRIAAFGEVMMRMQVPGYESLAQASSLQYSFSGTGVNIASALSRFGHSSYLVSTLPNNSIGEAATAYLRKLGIQTSFLSRAGKYVGMYFLENGFGIRPSRVTYSDRLGSSFNTSAPDTYDFSKIAQEIDIVHFCGITLAMNDSVRDQMKEFASEVKKSSGTVVFDCNFRPSLWGTDGYTLAKPHYEEMLGFADIVMMNEKDAIFTLGMETQEVESLAQLKDLIPKVAEKYGISVIAGTHRLVNRDNTHSLRGYIYKEGAFEFSEMLTFSVYDRIGAGDAYASGIIHGELSGFTTERTIAYASAAAMLAHTVVGDTPTSTEAEVLQAMTDKAFDVER
ncbi:sugar kinase [Paenibacillus glacialis]|uniref:2-dehydro-3-deoxygluconokinase n=1 Tax=Paenibacillus glacialis TaxID=494026 RepID=A0A162M7A1_9BACL|nr:sugar kinase [Paenibacillus glacialis]OAB39533.1 2-dehydro-3-deoxygluconokinase [Paenibacillus glacialis]